MGRSRFTPAWLVCLVRAAITAKGEQFSIGDLRGDPDGWAPGHVLRRALQQIVGRLDAEAVEEAFVGAGGAAEEEVRGRGAAQVCLQGVAVL